MGLAAKLRISNMLNPRTLFFQKQLLKKNVVLFVLSSNSLFLFVTSHLCFLSNPFRVRSISRLSCCLLGSAMLCLALNRVLFTGKLTIFSELTGPDTQLCLCVHCIAQDFSPQFRLRLRCMTSFDSFYTPFWLSNKIYTNQSVEIPNRTL